MCGRKRRELNLDERVPQVPLNQRGTLRALARSLGVPFSTLQRRLAWGDLRRHTNSLKPYLSLENRLKRLLYCISMIDEPSITDAKLIFKMMGNIMHMDEKWFDMTKRNRTYYLTPEEPDPVRTIRNHNNIGKVMFLTLVARPRFDAQGNMTFDGKVGIWAFVIEDVAKYNSKYQTKGDLMLKNLNVTRDVMREYLCEKVIPAIVEVWPDDGDVGTIWIQQDNARTHVPPDDPIFQATVKASGLDIRLTFQPPNSPDVNVLDLCFFSSIQSLAFESAPNSLKELIESVEQAYDAYDVNTLAKVYVTLQSVLVQIMKNQGGNTYKIIHMGKDKLIKEGNLPDTLEVDSELYEETLKLIEEYENQQKEEEETKIKVAQAKKTSKRKGRSQLIVDDDTIIAAKEYSTWLKDPSSIIRPSRRVKTVCQCPIACNYLY
jgi:antitoxin component of RelBE/YafQ-DinJ toxin-antitoxin module